MTGFFLLCCVAKLQIPHASLLMPLNIFLFQSLKVWNPLMLTSMSLQEETYQVFIGLSLHWNTSIQKLFQRNLYAQYIMLPSTSEMSCWLLVNFHQMPFQATWLTKIVFLVWSFLAETKMASGLWVCLLQRYVCVCVCIKVNVESRSLFLILLSNCDYSLKFYARLNLNMNLPWLYCGLFCEKLILCYIPKNHSKE